MQAYATKASASDHTTRVLDAGVCNQGSPSANHTATPAPSCKFTQQAKIDPYADEKSAVLHVKVLLGQKLRLVGFDLPWRHLLSLGCRGSKSDDLHCRCSKLAACCDARAILESDLDGIRCKLLLCTAASRSPAAPDADVARVWLAHSSQELVRAIYESIGETSTRDPRKSSDPCYLI